MFFCEISVIDSHFIFGLHSCQNLETEGKAKDFHECGKFIVAFSLFQIRFKHGSQNLRAFPNYIVKVNINHSPIHTFGQFVIPHGMDSNLTRSYFLALREL